MEVGYNANNLMMGLAPIATGVQAGLEWAGVPPTPAAMAGGFVDGVVSLFPPTGAIYNPMRVVTGAAAVGAGAAVRYGTPSGPLGGTGSFTDALGNPLMP